MAVNVARAYIRLSRLREGEEKLSPDVQLDSVRALCQSRGWQLDEKASTANADLDVSGYSIGWEKRAGLGNHYLDAQKGLYTHLIVSAIDRLGRNASDTINCWDQFESHGITLFSIRESLDASTPAGVLIRNIMASVAEMESRNASERIKANVAKRASLGRLHGGRLPFWLARNEENEIVVREDEAALIRLAIDMRVRGESYVQITRAINAAGFVTTRTKRPYERSFIVKILQKTDWIETMMGHAFTRRKGRYATDPRTKRRISRGDPIKIKNAYPAVIDDETGFRLLELREAAQSLIPDSDGVIRRNRRSQKWGLNGILKCAICGSRMGTHTRKLEDRERRTYFCEVNSANPQGDHERAMVDAAMIEMSVIVLLADSIKRIKTSPAIQSSPGPKNPRTVEDITKEIERLVALYARGTVPQDILEQQTEKLVLERDQLQRTQLRSQHNRTRKLEHLPDVKSISEIRELILELDLRISYPYFFDDILQPAQSKKKAREMKPCVVVEFPGYWEDEAESVYYEPHSWIVPLYRMEYTGPRWIYRDLMIPGAERFMATESDVALARAILQPNSKEADDLELA